MLSGNAVAAIVSLLIAVRLARAMRVEDFGEYSLFFAILVMVWQLTAFVDSSSSGIASMRPVVIAGPARTFETAAMASLPTGNP